MNERFYEGQEVEYTYGGLSKYRTKVLKRTQKYIWIDVMGDTEKVKIQTDPNYRNGDEHCQRMNGDYLHVIIS